MSVLADSNMKARTGQGGLEKDFNLNASVDAIKNLERKHGKRLDAFFRRNNGFGLESLTAREVDFLAFFGRENGIERSILEEKQAAYIADNARKQP